MQMALIIITCSAVSEAPLTKKWIQSIAGMAKTGKQAVWLVTFVSVLVSYLHWGLSLIVGALLAKELARELRIKNIPFEYGLIGAGAYVGQMTWHGMLSASIGLLIATPGHFWKAKSAFVSSMTHVHPMTRVTSPTRRCSPDGAPETGSISPLSEDSLRR